MFASLRRVIRRRRVGAVALLTFPKAGSQWMRDLLTHQLAEKRSGFANAMTSVNLSRTDEWPDLPEKRVVGPIYCASPDSWFANKGPSDKAIVVLRDPRDMIVSLHYSRVYSHTPTRKTKLLRKSLLSLPPQQMMMVCIGMFATRNASFAGWSKSPLGPGDSFFLTSYERMLANTTTELTAIHEFLGWSIPADDVDRIVRDLSFEARSGRQRGDEEVFSHFRKGVTGDWRRHFDKTCGVLFESLFPSLLVEAGYEDDPWWFEKLPVSRDETFTAHNARNLKARVELQAELVLLRERLQWVEQMQDKRRAS